MEYMTEHVTFNFRPRQFLHMQNLFERKHGRVLSDSEVMDCMVDEYRENPDSPLLIVESISVSAEEASNMENYDEISDIWCEESVKVECKAFNTLLGDIVIDLQKEGE